MHVKHQLSVAIANAATVHVSALLCVNANPILDAATLRSLNANVLVLIVDAKMRRKDAATLRRLDANAFVSARQIVHANHILMKMQNVAIASAVTSSVHVNAKPFLTYAASALVQTVHATLILVYALQHVNANVSLAVFARL